MTEAQRWDLQAPKYSQRSKEPSYVFMGNKLSMSLIKSKERIDFLQNIKTQSYLRYLIKLTSFENFSILIYYYIRFYAFL